MVCSSFAVKLVNEITMNTDMNNKQTNDNKKDHDPDFHGAALIDEEGNEIPITEDMVQDACSEPEENDENNNEGKPASPE